VDKGFVLFDRACMIICILAGIQVFLGACICELFRLFVGKNKYNSGMSAWSPFQHVTYPAYSSPFFCPPFHCPPFHCPPFLCPPFLVHRRFQIALLLHDPLPPRHIPSLQPRNHLVASKSGPQKTGNDAGQRHHGQR
jgi:hypothetical protein